MDAKVRRRLVVALLVPLTATALLAASCFGGGDDFPEVTPFPPELAEKLHSVRDAVARMRGLPVNEETGEGVLSRDAYRRYMEEQVSKLEEDERRQMEAYNIAWRLMRLIGPEDDLLRAATQISTEQVAGFYHPEKNRVVVVGERYAVEPREEFILAHEYVHAMQHGAFDLARFEKIMEDEEEGKANTEYGETVDCLQEGDAMVASVRYAEEVHGPDWYDRLYPPEEAPAEQEAASQDQVPPVLQRYFDFNYSYCVAFVAYLEEHGGWEAVDGAYEDPPTSTEQVLHPQKYVDRSDYSRNVRQDDLSKALGKGWRRLFVETFGEFDLYNYLVSIVADEPAASLAAEGWGSGWIAVYSAKNGVAESQDVVVQLTLDFDSTNDFAEFLAVYGVLLDTVSGGTWKADGPDGPVRWQGQMERGYLTWDADLLRIDVLFASTEEALRAVAPG